MSGSRSETVDTSSHLHHSATSAETGSQRSLSDPPDPHRPNKYHGAESTWRDWTATERNVSRSLDLLRSRDLAIHLFNSNSLRLRAHRLSQTGQVEATWRPFLGWDAWPMEADEVPRLDLNPDNSFEFEDELRRAHRSRQQLGELLLAHITKTARLRFKERQCDGCDGNHSCDVSGDIPAPTTTRKSRKDTTGKEVRGGKDSLSEDSPSDIATSISLQGSPSPNNEASDPSTQHQRRPHDKDQGYLEPVPIIDDDQAMTIAKPSIEHIISSLERLLYSLHTARQHFYRQSASLGMSRGSKMIRTEETFSEAVLAHSRRKRMRTQKDDSDDGFNQAQDEFEQSPSHSSEESENRPSGQDRQNQRARYGPRNWRDVLGIAAILGWDEHALRRATERCSKLLGGQLPLVKLDLDPKTSTADDATITLVDEDAMEGGVHVDGYLQPIKRRKGWKGKNKQKGNWKSRRKAMQEMQTTSGRDPSGDTD